MPQATQTSQQVLIKVHGSPSLGALLMTTWPHNFSFNGEVYIGAGSILQIDFPEHTIGLDRAVCAFSMALSTRNLTTADIEAFGPALCELWILRSADGGQTWTTAAADIPYQFAGRLSRSSIENGVWIAEVEPLRNNRLKAQQNWDAERQRQYVRNGEPDRGLDHLADLKNKKFSWPQGIE